MCRQTDEYCWAEVTCQICGQKMQGSFLRRRVNQVSRHYNNGKECYGIGMEAGTMTFLASTFIEYATRQGKLIKESLGALAEEEEN